MPSPQTYRSSRRRTARVALVPLRPAPPAPMAQGIATAGVVSVQLTAQSSLACGLLGWAEAVEMGLVRAERLEEEGQEGEEREEPATAGLTEVVGQEGAVAARMAVGTTGVRTGPPAVDDMVSRSVGRPCGS